MRTDVDDMKKENRQGGSIVDREKTIFYFKEMGFTEYEAKVYISLLAQHPASAYSVSRHSGVPHSRVYDITRRLIKKGYAISAGTNPELFSPLSPDELISKLQQDSLRNTTELKKHLEDVRFVSDFDPVWNLKDRGEAIEVAVTLIGEAEEDIYIGLWDDELEFLYPALKAANDRDVAVYWLIYGKKQVDFGEVFYHDTESFEGTREMGRTLDCVVDSRACLTGSLGGTNKKTTIVWTRNHGLVKSIEGYIIHDFYLAEIDKQFGPEITNVFGRNLGKLRRKFGH